MSLFGVGAMEAGLVLVIALVLVGPQRFPEIARQGGKWYRIARRFTAEVTKDLRAAVDEIEDEIQAEAAEFKSVRELGSLDEELKTAGGEIQAATESIATAAEEDSAAATTTATAATTSAASSEEPTAPANARDAGGVPGEPDPETLDPFKALEARQAAERSRGRDRNGSGETSS